MLGDESQHFVLYHSSLNGITPVSKGYLPLLLSGEFPSRVALSTGVIDAVIITHLDRSVCSYPWAVIVLQWRDLQHHSGRGHREVPFYLAIRFAFP